MIAYNLEHTMKDDFCHTQAEVDTLVDAIISTSDYEEGVHWKRKVQGRGTKVWWHKDVYEKLKSKQAEVTPEDWRPAAPMAPAHEVEQCKIVKIHPNFKWVDTDRGQVWVGLKGAQMKRGQVINVYLGKLYTGKIGPSGSLVRVP